MEHLNTTVCCSHNFTAKDITGRLLQQRTIFGRDDKTLFGGNAKRFAEAKCPECEKEYYLWLKPQGQTYRVLTISNKTSSLAPDFDAMDKPKLREWLDANRIEYVPQWGEERLRELAKQSYTVA